MRRRSVLVGVAVVMIAAGLALGLLRMHNSNPPVRSAEWLGDLTLGAIYAMPGALALLGVRQRPALLLAAGLLAMALGITSIVAFPFLVPAAVFLLAWGLERDNPAAKARFGSLAMAVSIAGTITACGVLLTLSTEYSWTDGSSSGSTSGLFTTEGAVIAIALISVGTTSAAWLAAPRNVSVLSYRKPRPNTDT